VPDIARKGCQLGMRDMRGGSYAASAAAPVVPISFGSSEGLDGQAPPDEGDSKTAAQRSERRGREILKRRMPAR
jgi:hypothetical protein